MNEQTIARDEGTISPEAEALAAEWDGLFGGGGDDAPDGDSDGGGSTESGNPEKSGAADAGTDGIPIANQDGADSGTVQESPAGEEAEVEIPIDELGKKPDSAPRKRTIRVNHEDVEIDLDKLGISGEPTEELLSLIRRGLAYESRAQAEAKRKEEETRTRLKDGQYDEDVIAAISAWRGQRAMEDFLSGDTPVPAAPPQTTPQTAKAEPPADRDQSEVAKFRRLFPDVKSIPKEVMTAYQNGAGLTEAYMAHQISGKDAEIQRLRSENQRMKRANDVAQRAPVKGVSGGGVQQKPTDEFEDAMNEYYGR